MAIRADQALIAAVAALGAYAGYRLLTAPRDQGPIDPARERPPPPPQDRLNIANATHLQLTPGRWFKGRLELPQLGATGAPDLSGLSTTSTRAQVEAALRTLGFDAVAVYTSLPEAQTIGFLDAMTANPTEGSRWFLARTRPDLQVQARPRPPQLVYLIFTAVPAPNEQPRPPAVSSTRGFAPNPTPAGGPGYGAATALRAGAGDPVNQALYPRAVAFGRCRWQSCMVHASPDFATDTFRYPFLRLGDGVMVLDTPTPPGWLHVRYYYAGAASDGFVPAGFIDYVPPPPPPRRLGLYRRGAR